MADCVISGEILDANNLPADGINVYCAKLIGPDLITDAQPKLLDTSDVLGLVSFTFPQGSTAYLSGNFFVNGTSFNVNEGVALSIPASATAELIDLAAVADFPDDGAIVQSNGTPLPLRIGTFNFGSGIAAVAGAAGVVNITADIAGSEAVQDALATFFVDSGAYDWSYDDALNKVSLVIAPATGAVNGLMSAADKTAFDLIGERNAANGYAGLSAGGLLTESQIPSSIARDSEVTALLASLAAIASSGSASDLSAGTIPDARFPATLPAASGVNLTALNATNIASGTLNAARLPATAALTGSSLAQFAATTSLELKTLISDETGSGALVFATSPTLETPVLGVASATSLNTALLNPTGNVIEQRNGTNAQTKRVYRTFDGTNNAWLSLGWSGNDASIRHHIAGSATTGRLLFESASGQPIRMTAGGIGSWDFVGNGHLFTVLDNTYDIGASGATRPRNVFVGGYISAGRNVVAKTGNYPVVAADKQNFFTNAGAVGTVVFTLPTAVAGLRFTFYVDAAQTLQVTAGASTTIRIAGSVSAAAGNITNATIGGCVTLQAISATSWVAESHEGTWVVT